MIEGMQERIKAIRKLERLAATQHDYQRSADAARARKEKAIREAEVLSVREAAEATGLSPARIQQIRKGAR